MLLGAALKACALLTAADLTAVLGEGPAKVRAVTPRPSVTQCLYALPKTATSVTVELTRGVPAQQLVDRLRGAARIEGDEASEGEEPAIAPVSSLGEEAFFALGSGTAGLYVWQKTKLLRVAIDNSDTNRSKLDKLRRLARRALSRLGQ